jgi:hypothetical protein
LLVIGLVLLPSGMARFGLLGHAGIVLGRQLPAAGNIAIVLIHSLGGASAGFAADGRAEHCISVQKRGRRLCADENCSI